MLGILLLAAMICDLFRRKIPNIIIVLGFSYSLWRHGFGAILPMLVVYILFFPLFYFRVLGAGDIKLMGMLAGILGSLSGLNCIILAWLLAGLYSFLRLAAGQSLTMRILYFLAYFRQFFNTGERKTYLVTAEDVRRYTIPFSVPLGAAYFLMSLRGGAFL